MIWALKSFQSQKSGAVTSSASSPIKATSVVAAVQSQHFFPACFQPVSSTFFRGASWSASRGHPDLLFSSSYR